MTYYSPKWIVVEFLRRRLTDPEDRAETATSDTFTATASQTDFALTPTSDEIPERCCERQSSNNEAV